MFGGTPAKNFRDLKSWDLNDHEAPSGTTSLGPPGALVKQTLTTSKKGKGREGKERKGKERKGKERKAVKERKEKGRKRRKGRKGEEGEEERRGKEWRERERKRDLI